MRRILLILGPLIALAVAGFGQTVVPFRIIDNRVVAPVMINDKGPFQCIIDTGAGSVISTETAKTLGLQVDLSESGGGVGEKQIMGGSATLRSVTLAKRIDFQDVSTRVIPFDDMLHVFGTARIDCIFGTPLFEKYIVTVDYDRRDLTLRHSADADAHGISISMKFAGIPIVSAKLDGIPGRFGVDLGARSALLLYTPFVEKNGLRAKYKAGFDTITGWGIGGPVRSQVARATSLQVAPVEVHNIVIRLSTQKSGATTGGQFDGLIGPDVLRQFRTTFDYAHHRILLEKGPQYGKPDTFDRFGAWMGQGSGKFVVLDVIPGGPADQAGLHKADLITSIDGVKTSELLLPDARAKLRALPPGTVVRVAVQRGNRILMLSVTLRDLV